ncbi:DNA-directed RNA polymerase 3 25 kd polypeptide [Grosmannia clavigera kw1407]|uniref:DNA-directed RNA polymerase subunit n=1 Tax=Grosmannia clavigera (strain kw1407 / UAMH 11150) TaxID=655863 RepID=F0XRQ6_GROCL|nr:DNA-directed RNA polymerase 3 25 kd polypeptide [Grosmannia clavigera kw1407]EFW99601.1 DNA-directed RNA polymerase 3 25 kd polypeptide [Grosmannia clavigera kw1407]
MFILTKIADLVRIEPNDFSKKSIQAIEDNINSKYANKIIQKIGLCICLYDLLWTSEGLIGHGDGYVNVNVRTDFFDDILIPYDELPDEAEYDINQQLWVWNVEGQRMFYDMHEMVRFRVIDEEWHDQTPTKPIERGEEPEEHRNPPYRIQGSMKDPGLGVCIWWD